MFSLQFWRWVFFMHDPGTNNECSIQFFMQDPGSTNECSKASESSSLLLYWPFLLQLYWSSQR